MIDAILLKDWVALRAQLITLFVFYSTIMLAVLVDLYAGVQRAKALHERVMSDKLRRTVIKITEYYAVCFIGLFIDIVLSRLDFYNECWASMVLSFSCIIIEGKSVLENLAQKKSAAAKLPDVMKDIINAAKNGDKFAVLDAANALLKISDKRANEKPFDTCKKESEGI